MSVVYKFKIGKPRVPNPPSGQISAHDAGTESVYCDQKDPLA